MWAGVCGSSGAGERERDSVSTDGDIHKWIKRALLLYKHIEITGDLCIKNSQPRKYKRDAHTQHTHTHKGGFLWEPTVF